MLQVDLTNCGDELWRRECEEGKGLKEKKVENLRDDPAKHETRWKGLEQKEADVDKETDLGIKMFYKL